MFGIPSAGKAHEAMAPSPSRTADKENGHKKSKLSDLSDVARIYIRVLACSPWPMPP